MGGVTDQVDVRLERDGVLLYLSTCGSDKNSGWHVSGS